MEVLMSAPETGPDQRPNEIPKAEAGDLPDRHASTDDEASTVPHRPFRWWYYPVYVLGMLLAIHGLVGFFAYASWPLYARFWGCRIPWSHGYAITLTIATCAVGLVIGLIGLLLAAKASPLRPSDEKKPSFFARLVPLIILVAAGVRCFEWSGNLPVLAGAAASLTVLVAALTLVFWRRSYRFWTRACVGLAVGLWSASYGGPFWYDVNAARERASRAEQFSTEIEWLHQVFDSADFEEAFRQPWIWKGMAGRELGGLAFVSVSANGETDDENQLVVSPMEAHLPAELLAATAEDLRVVAVLGPPDIEMPAFIYDVTNRSLVGQFSFDTGWHPAKAGIRSRAEYLEFCRMAARNLRFIFKEGVYESEERGVVPWEYGIAVREEPVADPTPTYLSKTVREWIELRQSRFEYTARHAEMMLEKLVDKRLPKVVDALKDKDFGIRRAAIELLANAGPGAREAIGALSDCLVDGDASVRLAAKEALSRIDRKEAVSLLERRLDSENPTVRLRAAGGLLLLVGDHDKAMRVLRETVQLHDESIWFWATIILREFAYENRDAVVALATLMTSDTRQISRMATCTLAALDPAATAAILIEETENAHQDVRTAAIRCLATAGEPAIPPLEHALHDKDPDVRCYAAGALAWIGATDSKAQKSLVPALGDEDPRVRRLASDRMWRIASPDNREILEDMLSSENEKVRLDAVRGLVRLGAVSAETIQSLIAALDHENPEMRFHACILAGLAGSPAHLAVPRLINQLDDTDRWARAAAVFAVGRIDASAAKQKLVELLEDESPILRGLAAAALATEHLRDGGDITSLAEMMTAKEDLWRSCVASAFQPDADLFEDSGRLSYYSDRCKNDAARGLILNAALLARFHTDSPVATLKEAFSLGAEPELRSWLAHAMLNVGCEAIPTLMAFNAMSSRYGEGHSLAALEAFGPEARKTFENGLTSRLPGVRPVAVSQLGRLGPDATPTLVQALRDYRHEEYAFPQGDFFGAWSELYSSGPEVIPALKGMLEKDGPVQGLLRFDDLFGDADGRIPPGSSIEAAFLDICVAGSAYVQLHQMLVPWDETSTWNTSGDGIQSNDVEALAAPDQGGLLDGHGSYVGGFPVIATIQAWAKNPERNHGWLLIASPNSPGLCFLSSETNRGPRLIVHFTPPGETAKVIVFQQKRNGYGATVDTHLRATAADVDFGQSPTVRVTSRDWSLPDSRAEAVRILKMLRVADEQAVCQALEIAANDEDQQVRAAVAEP